jgi:hypothetical protein
LRIQANTTAVQGLQSNDAAVGVRYAYAMASRSFGGGSTVDLWKLRGVDRGT